MSNSNAGSVLGAATTVGLLAQLLADWKYALLAAGLILLLGLFLILWKRRKKNQEK